jgi:hypothetical protein
MSEYFLLIFVCKVVKNGELIAFLLAKFSTGRVVGGLWVRLGKIKCAAKALICVLACSSFNFAKRWHFVVHCQHGCLMLKGSS